MIILTILLSLLLVWFGSWILIEIHSSKRTAKWLFVLIPVLFCTPVAFYFYGNSLLGYAVHDVSRLEEEWTLVHAAVSEEQKAVFALVLHKGEKEPRLYKITKNYDQAKQKFGQAQEKVKKGVPVKGKLTKEVESDAELFGTFVFYDLPPSEVQKKN